MQKLHVLGIPGLLAAGLLTGCLGDPATPLEVTGANSLAAVTDAPTSTCATGGKVVSVGVDDNQDGTLQDTEIDASTPVCNGAVGVTGATGATGATGEQGIPGEIGNVGPQGQTGAQGAQGDTGPMGPRGDQGNLGPTGDQGDTGLPGPVGEPGKNGGTAAFRQEIEYPGDHCPKGGTALRYGLDRDGNGLLDSVEADGVAYVCNDNCGNYTCGGSCGTCSNGFACGWGQCSDVNECASNMNNCSNFASCTNTEGSFECACNEGYSGNGVTCTVPSPFNGSFESDFRFWGGNVRPYGGPKPPDSGFFVFPSGLIINSGDSHPSINTLMFSMSPSSFSLPNPVTVPYMMEQKVAAGYFAPSTGQWAGLEQRLEINNPVATVPATATQVKADVVWADTGLAIPGRQPDSLCLGFNGDTGPSNDCIAHTDSSSTATLTVDVSNRTGQTVHLNLVYQFRGTGLSTGRIAFIDNIRFE